MSGKRRSTRGAFVQMHRDFGGREEAAEGEDLPITLYRHRSIGVQAFTSASFATSSTIAISKALVAF